LSHKTTFNKDTAAALIWIFFTSIECEGFAFLDADRCEQAQRVKVYRVGWFTLHDAIDELE